MMHKHTSFLVTGAVLVATVAAMTLYNVNVANAQIAHVPNMTKTITSGVGNMSKNMNMTSSNMGKTINTTAVGNMSKK